MLFWYKFGLCGRLPFASILFLSGKAPGTKSRIPNLHHGSINDCSDGRLSSQAVLLTEDPAKVPHQRAEAGSSKERRACGGHPVPPRLRCVLGKVCKEAPGGKAGDGHSERRA